MIKTIHKTLLSSDTEVMDDWLDDGSLDGWAFRSMSVDDGFIYCLMTKEVEE